MKTSYWICLCLLGIFLGFLGGYAAGVRVPDALSPAASEVQADPGSTPTPKATPTVVPYSGKIDLNTATSEELQTLPGIGETIAGAIIAYREQIGGFTSIEQLMEVPRIGATTFEKLKNLITVG